MEQGWKFETVCIVRLLINNWSFATKLSFDVTRVVLNLVQGHASDSHKWGLHTKCHGIQISLEAILACHPARSTEWLDSNPKSCELWRILTGPITQFALFFFLLPQSASHKCDSHKREKDCRSKKDAAFVCCVFVRVTTEQTTCKFPWLSVARWVSRATLLISPSSLIEFAVETLEGWFWSYSNG